MPDPLVSVCIPCYNASLYIGAAIESILAQSWGNTEIIIVNDGSTDDSARVLDAYTSSKVHVLHQENRGQCAAANRALSEAQGELIKFFDADDLLSPKSIEHQVYRLNGREDAVASSCWGRFYNNDCSTFQLNPQSVWRDLPALEWLVEAWADARPMMQCGLWLIPRLILERSGGWDERLSLINDFEFFARVLVNTNEVLFTPEATLYYRSGLLGTLSGQKSRKAVESAFQSLLTGTCHLLQHRSDTEARQSCANLLQDFNFTYYPDHHDLRTVMQNRILELGGSNLVASGGPAFMFASQLVGWKLTTRIKKLASRFRRRPPF